MLHTTIEMTETELHLAIIALRNLGNNNFSYHNDCSSLIFRLETRLAELQSAIDTLEDNDG